MAYRLKPGRSAGKELSRLVGKAFERTIAEMADVKTRPAAVHDARKRVKKIRAILHLLKPALGKAYRINNARLRTVAHQLSAPRDAAAAIETMAAVRQHYPGLMSAAMFASVRRGLTPRKRGAASRLRAAPVRRELRRSAKTMPRLIRRAADWKAIRRGLMRGYSRARKALQRVKAAPEDIAFHAWRRRVKDHWYHVRLLDAVHPPVRARISLLKRLETWLGDDHNLVLLRAALLDAPASFGDERATAIVLGCIEKYQASLRQRALTLGDRLFARRPAVFAGSLPRVAH